MSKTLCAHNYSGFSLKEATSVIGKRVYNSAEPNSIGEVVDVMLYGEVVASGRVEVNASYKIQQYDGSITWARDDYNWQVIQ
jgi:hypothetical protein